MILEELKIQLQESFPSSVFEENTEWINFSIDSENIQSCLQTLKTTFFFDYLFCLTCIDFKTHFTMVYHLSSSKNRLLNIVVKSKVDRENPVIESVSAIFKTAEFHEREVFDLFGVSFKNHPDLRRLLLTEEWEGYPLRKDYEDPINMIKL
jgi:NADH-quinone oxidoreductase subunit C